MNKKYLILFLCTIIFIAIIFTCVMVFSNSNSDSTKNKVIEEIDYIEIKLIGMLNSLNNIPFSDSILLEKNNIKGQNNEQASESEDSSSSNSDSSNNTGSSSNNSQSSNTESKNYTSYNVETQNILVGLSDKIDWNYIKNAVEELYTTWPTIMIDFHSLNVKNEDILTFSNNLDTLILNIQKEDKKATLNSLSTLYSYLPIYISQISDNSEKINILYTKSYIIKSYVLLEDNNWNEMQAQITKAQEYFGLIINSVNTNKSESEINKTYILLNEIKNAIALQDKTLYYLKYKNLMENAMSI